MNNIKLRIVSLKRDTQFLYNSMINSDQYLFSTKILCNTKQRYEEWFIGQLRNHFHDFFIVELNNQQIGYVHNYDFSIKDGRCKIVVFIAAKYRTTGIGGVVAIDFMKYLFDSYPLRKVYLDIYDYNKQSLESNLRAGFKEEGQLKEYRFYNGKLFSVHVLSIDRNSFDIKLRRKI